MCRDCRVCRMESFRIRRKAAAENICLGQWRVAYNGIVAGCLSKPGTPDKSAIDYNIARALALAGREAADQYTIMKEDGFFDRIIAAGIHCEIRVDSVKIDVAQYPYAARLWGKTSLVRTSNVTYRNLETECQLVNCARSDDNPHGFMIEKWRILDNSDIAVLER